MLDVAIIYDIAYFVSAINPNLIIPQEDSHICFPDPIVALESDFAPAPQSQVL